MKTSPYWCPIEGIPEEKADRDGHALLRAYLEALQGDTDQLDSFARRFFSARRKRTRWWKHHAPHSVANGSMFSNYSSWRKKNQDPRRAEPPLLTEVGLWENARVKLAERHFDAPAARDTSNNVGYWVGPKGNPPRVYSFDAVSQIHYSVGPDRRTFRRCTQTASDLTGAEGYQALLTSIPYRSVRWEGVKGINLRRPWTMLPFGSVSQIDGSLNIPTVNIPTQTVGPSERDVTLARQDALASMYAGTPRSRPNFLRALLELKDTNATARGLADLFRWGQRSIRGLHHAVRSGTTWRFVRKRTRVTIRQMAGAYLNAQFGILPTVADATQFLDTLRKGLSVFAEDRGRTLQEEGAVVTAHYRVRSRDAARLLQPKQGYSKSSLSWTAFSPSTALEPVDISFGPSTDAVTSMIAASGRVKETRVDGAVFARMLPKSELSEYFKANFGKVGYTWSYPGITTAWELLPWSWLVDWFADCRRKIRVAERLARSYWMRVGFEAPWIWERTTVRTHIPYVTATFDTPGPSPVRFYGWGGFDGSSAYASYGILWRYYLQYTSSGGTASNWSFSRTPWEEAPHPQDVCERSCRVNLFRISIGMSLIAQAASKDAR